LKAAFLKFNQHKVFNFIISSRLGSLVTKPDESSYVFYVTNIVGISIESEIETEKVRQLIVKYMGLGSNYIALALLVSTSK
jgi:hypothetical protein